MATVATTAPRQHAVRVARPSLIISSYSLWQREIVRFYRQRARVIGVIASPLLFWVAFGAGFSHSFSSGNSGASGHAFGYFFPGAIVMIVLFTAIFSMMSLIQDRNEGFLLTVLASPVSRSAIVLGKVLGGATLAAIQGLLFLLFSPLAGVHPTFAGVRCFRPEAVAGALDEDVFEARARDRDGADLAGERIEHSRKETVAVFAF